MSYEQQNWVTGNRITAEKLNHMEQGISSAGGGTALIIRYDRTEGDVHTFTHYFDKTWQEVANALTNFTPVYIRDFDPTMEKYNEDPLSMINISSAYEEDGDFYVQFGGGGIFSGSHHFCADSANSVLYVRGDKVN